MGEKTFGARVDLDRANAARMYDYLLGGGHNFAVDREAAARVLEGYPEAREAALSMRAFLGRVVAWACEQGIDQFLDLGSGIPSVGNVHEVALARVPTARVAYVDVEPVAVAHSREILEGVPRTSVTAADVRDPDAVLGAPGVADLLDFGRPVAVLAFGLLHFLEGDLAPLLARFRAELVPGSVVAVNQSSDDQDDPGLRRRMEAVREAYRDTASQGHLRDRAEIRALMAGLDLVGPGIVDVTDWPFARPADRSIGVYAAVGRVPGA